MIADGPVDDPHGGALDSGRVRVGSRGSPMGIRSFFRTQRMMVERLTPDIRAMPRCETRSRCRFLPGLSWPPILVLAHP
jgi:hypothetical protein